MYMAPEFFTGENPTYDRSVDLFAMGMLFLTMIQARKGQPLVSPKTGQMPNHHSITKTRNPPLKLNLVVNNRINEA